MIVSCSHQFPKNNSNLLEISYFSNASSDTVYAYVPDGKTFKNIPSVYYRKYLDAFSDSLFLSVNDDSLKTVLNFLLREKIDKEKIYFLVSSSQDNKLTKLQFSMNDDYLKYIEKSLLSIYIEKKTSLFDNQKILIDWKIIALPKILLPCDGINIPTKASRLPNAPRDYRNGIHRGIDFFANWGTPVRAVASGTVIRSDTYFEEVSPEFRKTLLISASNINRTPSDIFEHILLGKTVILDHGLDLIHGFRVITIYAHLSNINDNIKPGVKISAGELIGQTGNTGTAPSTLRKREEAHLHWEMILQNEGGEFYLGEGLPYKELFPILTNMFK